MTEAQTYLFDLTIGPVRRDLPLRFGAGQVFWYFVVGLWPLLYWLVYL